MKPTTNEKRIIDNSHVKVLGIVLACIACAFMGANLEYRPIIVTNVTRSLNTSYQPSTTRYTLVSISSSITSTLSLTGGQSGTITLQVSPDNSTWTTMETTTNNNTGTLTVGLNTSQAQTTDLTCTVPPGSYYKFVSSGTSTFGILMGQETQL